MTKAPSKRPPKAKPCPGATNRHVRGGCHPRRVAKKQPKLALDQMPEETNRACLALLRPIRQGPTLAFEIKWDGYRWPMHVEQTGVRLLHAGGGPEWTERFTTSPGAAAELGLRDPGRRAVVHDAAGEHRIFDVVAEGLGGRWRQAIALKPSYTFFDLLYLDGHDIRFCARERRQVLRALCTSQDGRIRVSRRSTP